MQTGMHATEMSHSEQKLIHSRKFLGVKRRVFFGNLVLCVLVCIYAHIYSAIFLFAFIQLLTLRLSIKDKAIQSWNMKSVIKVSPMQNRWHW